MAYDPELNKADNQALDDQIKALIKDGWSEHQAQQAAPIMLGLSDGDVVEVEK